MKKPVESSTHSVDRSDSAKTESEKTTGSNERTRSSRRQSIMLLGFASGTAATQLVKTTWIEPVVQSVVLPAHAATSGTTGGGGPGPVDISLQCTNLGGSVVTDFANQLVTITLDYTVQATLNSGPASTSLAGIPFGIDYTAVFSVQPIPGEQNPPPDVSNGTVGTFPNATGADGSFTTSTTVGLVYQLGRLSLLPGRFTSLSLTLDVLPDAATPATVTSFGNQCVCNKGAPIAGGVSLSCT